MELQVQVREDDQFKAQKAYLGAVVQMGEESEVSCHWSVAGYGI